MAYVKIYFSKSARNVLEYVQREKGPDDPSTAHGFLRDNAAEAFKEVAQHHGERGTVQAIHIIQSWSPEDSQKHDANTFHRMGQQLVSRYFEGHDFLVTTHTETGKTHNHIVVNPWHSETGKKVENKKYHLHKLRDLNDEISRSYGLSIIDRKAKDRAAHLPDKVQRMIRFNGRSYLLDLIQKADVARAYATGFDDYVSMLAVLDIKAVVQNRNITYFYPGKERGKRGSKLGKSYDKPGLIERFAENERRIRAHPEIGAFVRRELETIRNDPAALGRTLANLSAPSKLFTGLRGKGAPAMEKTGAPLPLRVSRSEHDLRAALVPIIEIARAKNQSIVDYARRHGIGLTKNPDGSHTLTGRPHVQIHDSKWVNTKNRTQGSLIDFVAAYRRTSFLRAVAEINGNPGLLLLEHKLGSVERKFTSFYIPQKKRLRGTQALDEVAGLFRAFGVSPSKAASLLESQQLQVARPGLIRLFPKNDYQAGLEFERSGDGRWHSKNMGKNLSPFHISASGRRTAVVFTDPFSFIDRGGPDPFTTRHRAVDVLALFEPDSKAVDLFLGQNPNVKELQFVPPPPSAAHKSHGDFWLQIKARYAKHNVSVELLPLGRQRGGRELDVI